VVDLAVADFLAIDPIASVRRRADAPIEPSSPMVSIALVGDRAFIVSGIRRRHLWLVDSSCAPETLHVAVHRCSDHDAAYRLYRRYERAGFDDDSVAQIMAGYQDNGLKLSSTRLKDGRIANALYLAFRGEYGSEDDDREPMNLRKAIGCVRDELVFLDNLGCPSRVFYSGVLAVAILGLAVDPRARGFVERIARKQGNKRDGLMDPVECVLFLVTLTDMMDRSQTLNYQPELFRRCLRALEAWLSTSAVQALNEPPSAHSSFWFKGKLREHDPSTYVRSFREEKKILNQVDL